MCVEQSGYSITQAKLCDAIYRSDIEHVKLLLPIFGNVNMPLNDGYTLLGYAVRFNSNSDMVKFLLKIGANIHAKELTGLTPLCIALYYNPNYDIIKTLLDNGANIHRKDSTGLTPLWVALYHNPNYDSIKALLDSGANIEDSVNGKDTPLIYAIKHTCKNAFNITHPIIDINIIELLLEYKADCEAPVSIGFNLHELKCIDTNTTALCYCCYYSYENATYDTVKLLLKHGADVNRPDLNGNRPLHYAVRGTYGERYELVKLLLDYGADIEKYNPECPPLAAITYGGTVSQKIIKLLIEHGANFETRSSEGLTTLHCSIRREPTYINYINFILDQGANLHATTTDGKTPIQLVFYYGGDLKTIKGLLDRGANPDSADLTVILLAALKGKCDEFYVKFALDRGVDINAPFINKTPLEWIISDSYYNAFELIHKYGADLNQLNSDGISPLMYASTRGRYAAVAYLLKNGVSPE